MFGDRRGLGANEQSHHLQGGHVRLSHNCFNSLPLTHLRSSLFWKHQFLCHLRFYLTENLFAEVSSLIAPLKDSLHTNLSRPSQGGESSEVGQSWGKPAGIDLPCGFMYTKALVDLLTLWTLRASS